ncbi:adenosylcobinamide-phosphate synthase CbiB [Amaricoccus sp.]|uniref:adenosylcobinamide-phosphate synthase CbiB n=1 Tax=Amaricoccus sp. TaxID=1872485 RepID=UPI001B65851A|nr:adenosylcobinamide-phosphate synthase CbiB [Amaricoccus sp.]MBP7242363.1 cobalamin biosynthesis protein CobD [Amaricoccus sp.]
MGLLLPMLAMLAELLTGYPDAVFRRIGHPVIWIGTLIGALERLLNRGSVPRRRISGVIAISLAAAAVGSVGAGLEALLGGPVGLVVAACLAGSLIAQRSLADHVQRVADALDAGGVEAGRLAVAHIVGRDPEALDVAGVSRAAVESLAENFSDGVVAPVLWMTIAGLPGAIAYKTINTADSMIGHRTERYRAFGWASARLDDLVNLPASRLTALLLVAAAALVPGASPRGAARAIRRDARRHRSPNAGWPEAAMAGALGFALAGPRSYGGLAVDDAIMGAGGRRDLGSADIRRALRLYRAADALLVTLLAAGVIWTI